jgi:hypothetical protein
MHAVFSLSDPQNSGKTICLRERTPEAQNSSFDVRRIGHVHVIKRFYEIKKSQIRLPAGVLVESSKSATGFRLAEFPVESSTRYPEVESRFRLATVSLKKGLFETEAADELRGLLQCGAIESTQ